MLPPLSADRLRADDGRAPAIAGVGHLRPPPEINDSQDEERAKSRDQNPFQAIEALGKRSDGFAGCAREFTEGFPESSPGPPPLPAACIGSGRRSGAGNGNFHRCVGGDGFVTVDAVAILLAAGIEAGAADLHGRRRDQEKTRRRVWRDEFQRGFVRRIWELIGNAHAVLARPEWKRDGAVDSCPCRLCLAPPACRPPTTRRPDLVARLREG